MSRLEGERLVQALERVRGQGVQIAYTIIASTIYPVQKYLMLSLITFGIVMGIFALRAITTGYTYSATASLLLSPPAYLQKGPASDLMPKPLDIPSYARLLTDDAILKAVCDNVYEKDPSDLMINWPDHPAGEVPPVQLVRWGSNVHEPIRWTGLTDARLKLSRWPPPQSIIRPRAPSESVTAPATVPPVRWTVRVLPLKV